MPNNSPQNQTTRERHRLDFFRPDQITFLVTHEAFLDGQIENGRLNDKILEKWSSALDNHLKDLSKRHRWTRSRRLPIRSYTFPALGDAIPGDMPDGYSQGPFSDIPFSIIVYNVERLNPGDNAGMEVNGHGQETGRDDEENPGKGDEQRASAKHSLLDFITDLDSQLKHINLAGLTIEGVFPNWIISGSSSDSGGTGGPGGPPVPYIGSSEPAPAAFYFLDLINQLKSIHVDGKELYGKGEGVDVIILDTAPPPADLVLAHKELVLLKEDDAKHRLIENLLGPDGRLKLYPATYEEQLRMGNTSLNTQGYKMPDHGLFIAGIIHSIVPFATIHLIEVLNQFGVGDMETLANGMEKAYVICRQASLSNRKAVINGSWCLDLPDLNEEFAYEPTENEEIPVEEKQLEERLRNIMDTEMAVLESHSGKHRKELKDDQYWVTELRVLCEQLSDFGRQVVAAAGNQGKNAGRSRHAPDARYPAAFTKVVGAGALPKNAARNDGTGQYDASSFSNLGDVPEHRGIMALGGEPGEGEGVLGIYLGEFPPEITASDPTGRGTGWDRSGQKCINGWAWWAGTSFATPILTGAIASVLSGDVQPSSTQRAVQILYDEGVILSGKTEAEEDVMPTTLQQSHPPSGWPF
jgi:hypothetical protein